MYFIIMIIEHKQTSYYDAFYFEYILQYYILLKYYFDYNVGHDSCVLRCRFTFGKYRTA